MNRLFRIPVYCGFFVPATSLDKPTFEGNVTASEYAKINPMNKTGIEGLKRMWSYDEYGGFSKEITMSIQTGIFSGLAGGIFGSIKHGKTAFTRWMQVNLGNKYISEADAKRYLVDAIGLGMFKGFFVSGSKIGLLVATYMLATNSVTTYRGTSGIPDFTIGGALAGGAFQFWNGPKRVVVGALTGSVIGLIGGCSVFLILKAAGKSYDELRASQIEFMERREKAFKESEVPDWQKRGQNAVLLQRTYDKEKDLFKKEPPS